MPRRRVVDGEEEVASPLVESILEAEIEREQIEMAGDGDILDEPVTYYNPICVNESFRVPGSLYFRRFAAGRFTCERKSEESRVRAALAAYGADKVERWRGNNRGTPENPKFWECKRCVFVCANDEAIEDHQAMHG